ncbi:hypothetical protein [Dactylosporangium sp. NPDC000521]|uniref:hypothetical protein n=1 Tax=Dactylosporangium sp. NPDC000521 TaxID=3363975 RepID=UPI0036BC7AA5
MDQPVEIVWSRSLCMRSSARTVAASNVLVVAERYSRLVGLDPATEALMWEQRVEDCWGTTTVAQGRCLYLSQRGVLHCFEHADPVVFDEHRRSVSVEWFRRESFWRAAAGNCRMNVAARQRVGGRPVCGWGGLDRRRATGGPGRRGRCRRSRVPPFLQGFRSRCRA